MNDDQIEEFVDSSAVKALGTLLSASADEDISSAAVVIASAFNVGDSFKKIVDVSSDGEEKLNFSFHKNLVLLIQKTWVEKSDEELKAQVLYHLDEFIEYLNKKSYKEAYPLFFSIVDDVVYLMFGSQTKTKGFNEYALRIDPEFGIFWWYMKNLPRTADWSEFKMRAVTLLGMYFLANY